MNKLEALCGIYSGSRSVGEKALAPRPIKFSFYLDENFPEPAGKFFKVLGHSVMDGKKVVGVGGSDFRHIIAATKRGEIPVGLDKDFLVNDDLLDHVRNSPGAILFKVTGSKLALIQKIIIKLLKDAGPKTFHHKICIASIDKIKFEITDISH